MVREGLETGSDGHRVKQEQDEGTQRGDCKFTS